ncbi:MAG: hypothetical protein GX133_00020 [Syntrophomonadaceae bacterium]|nr:hypothetical protein [Syntrophomonadaceae bacterium]
MKNKNRFFWSYIALVLLFGLGMWQSVSTDGSFGVGLMAGAIGAFVALSFKQARMRRLEAQGMNVYDERVWFVAGRAAYAAYVTFALGCALVVLLGSIWGPQVLVNPYNLLGVALSILVLLYVVYYHYYNARS